MAGRRIRTVLGAAIVAAGIGIYLYPNLREWQMNARTRELIAQFEQTYNTDGEPTEEDSEQEAGSTGTEVQEQETESTQTARAFEELYQQMLSYNQGLIDNGQSLVDAWSYEQEPIDLSALSDEDCAVGYIEIPAMDVTLPLYIGATTEHMAKGAAVLSETSMPIGGESTNCVIAGHRGYSGMPYFREIEKLEIGDLVYITNPWETLTYKVTEIAVIDPDDVESILIVPGKDMVTLLTCHPYMSHGKYRYVVYCERTGETTGTEADDTDSTETELVDTDSTDINSMNIDSTGTDLTDADLADTNSTDTDSADMDAADTDLTDTDSAGTDMSTNAASASTADTGDIDRSDATWIVIEKGIRILLPVIFAVYLVVILMKRKKRKKK
ncbi:MAG: class C sortase [Clostridiales bacterium]|nr:class C sortase [Clostridiales bacterium]